MLNITHYQRNANQNHNEVPLHARNKSFLKELNLDYSLEGLMLKLKFQYSLEKSLVLGTIEGRGRRG